MKLSKQENGVNTNNLAASANPGSGNLSVGDVVNSSGRIRLGKAAILGALALVTIGAIILAGLPTLERWQSNRFLAQARTAAAAGDYSSAFLACQSACLKNPDNQEAATLLSEIGSHLPEPVKFSWAHRWVRLHPDSVPARMYLARLMAARGDMESAWKQIESLPDRDHPDPAFQSLIGTLALARNDVETARRHTRLALDLAPHDAVLELNYIMALYKSGNILQNAEADERLRRLADDPQTRSAAQRTLISIKRDQLLTTEAIEICRSLVQENPESLKDWLVLVELLKEAGKSEWRSELAQLQARAESAARPGAMIGVAQWLQQQGLGAESTAWLEASPRTALEPTLVRILAEGLMEADRWKVIIDRFAGTSWGMQDVFREAILARATRQQGAEAAAQAHWMRARRLGLDNPVIGEGLTRYIKNWPRWQPERLELMWDLVDEPQVLWAVLESLEAHYQASGEARGLWRIGQIHMRIDPANEIASNNYAMFCLLLDQNTQEGHMIAERLYRQYPDEELPISTYSFSLYRQGKTVEALELFNKIPAHIRRMPIFSGYYGLLLAEAGGDPSEAASLLRARLSYPATDVERDLFESALARMSSK